MKHKKLLLVAIVLVFFIAQQARVGAETVSETSSSSPLSTFTPPTNVFVTYYHMTFPDGVVIVDRHNHPVPCTTRKSSKFYDDTYGCTEVQNGGYWWSYPYPPDPTYGAGVYSNPVETNYLPDVLSHEMDPHTYPNPQSEMAQAIASRTYVYYKINNNQQVTNFGNVPQAYQGPPFANQTDIPYSFAVYLNNLSTPTALQISEPGNLCQNTPNLTSTEIDVCNAISNTQGIYLTYNNAPIDAEYGDDAGSVTVMEQGTNYNIAVDDPNGTTCGAEWDYSGWGMSQKGANRWELGNQCASGGTASTKWISKWTDYRQILAHYYSGVDFLNGSGSRVVTTDRWNMLNFNNNTPPSLGAGATNTYAVMLQNTSTMTWAVNSMLIGYQWTPIGGTVQHANWQAAGGPFPSNSAILAGHSTNVNMQITAPTTPGVYTLHLDLQYAGAGWWFSEGGWDDAEVDMGCVGGSCTAIIQGGDDAGINPLGCYFSALDNEVYLGEGFNSCGSITSGFRFQNLPIPYGATINSAYVQFTTDGLFMDPITITIDGELNPNALTYSQSDQPSDPSRINNLTGNPVSWPITTTWNLGDVQDTPDLSAAIQQIVNQQTWVISNNAVSIIFQNNNNSMSVRRVIAFERALFDPILHPAILVVTYTP